MKLAIRDLAFLASSGGVAYDAEVLDWEARVIANGGTISLATKNAANVLMVSIKAVTGLRTAIKRLNLFAGDQLAAAVVPLIRDVGSAGYEKDSADNPSFITYSEAAGINVNVAAGGKYIITNLNDNQSPIATADQHIGIYMRTKIGGEEALVMGTGSGSGGTYIYFPSAGSSVIGSIHNPAGDITASDSVQTGHYILTRGGSGAFLYRNGTQIGTNATPSGTTTGYAFSICSVNLNGNGWWNGAQTSRKSGGYHIGTNLDDTQTAAISTIFQTFNATLARQV